MRESFGDHHPEVVEYDNNRKNVSASASKRAKMVRSCKYCGTKGHNTRTCAMLKKHIDMATSINKEYCGVVHKRMMECGIGVGAIVRMIRYRSGYYKSSEALYLIVDVGWERINFLEPHRKVMRAKCIETSDFVNLAMPVDCPDININSWEVASPVHACVPPDGWLSGSHIKQELTDITIDQAQELLGMTRFVE